MAGDVLIELLSIARERLPDVPDAIWADLEAQVRGEYGGAEHYIARRSKARLIDRIEAAQASGEQLTNDQLASSLGCSVRRVQQLKRLVSGR